ncbi:MAG: bifunctional adenosylcobinamide kinase/adenosylcobinamide-phosphate guanylyltransferase [Chloroflexi bacterium]|nr:bifunctional adenosylcobinamide kinase/adenosylcobinamide-phosphate guanylyltransferase [Chloroflexota bacterium]
MPPPTEKTLTLIIGGARSGKSSLAERLASRRHRVLFVATAQPGDAEMAERIAAHRAARPDDWDTLEEPLNPAGAILSARGDGGERYDVIVIDCLTLWVSNLMLAGNPAISDAPDYDAETATLLETYESGDSSWIVVTNEVGLGVVPPSESGRAFRDALGRVNAAFAHRADHVISMTAGLALDLKSLGARPWMDFPGD